jgi:beta-xylosidase
MKTTHLNMPFFLVWIVLMTGAASCKSHDIDGPGLPPVTSDSAVIDLADPTIFFHDGTYYLYGTGGNIEGFLVYTSSDMTNWKGPAGVNKGYALIKGDTYGTKGFWAPQVFEKDHKFYMAYTADEHIAIAESASPLGPFKQASPHAISGPVRQIDPFVYTDDNGKVYLYHVRLDNGNRLFVAEMKADFSDIVPGTAHECLTATEPWENTAHSTWPVTEGPTLLKHNSVYYLFYSANSFEDIHYAVGYATAPSPTGPWTKFKGNPIISRHNTGKNGSGHGDFIEDENHDLFYVFHTHRSDHSVSPRLTAIIAAKFQQVSGAIDELAVDPETFRYLYSRPR